MYRIKKAVWIIVMCLVVLSLDYQPAGAQVQKEATRASQPIKKAEAKKIDAQPVKKIDTEPVRITNPNVNASTEQIWSGNSQVILRANDNPIIRIYMAQGGSTLVELPEKDQFFAIHPPPPDPQLIVLEDSPTKASDRHFLLRPGKDFVVPVVGNKHTTVPAATITVQMRSGMTFTLMAYPVRDLRLNAHHIVVMYDPVAVTASRRAGGLSTNIGFEHEPSKPQPATTVRFPDEKGKAVSNQQKLVESYKTAVKEQLTRFSSIYIKKDAKEFPGLGLFGKEEAGLRVAASEIKRLDDNRRVVIVAVQSRKNKEVRLIHNGPTLLIETTHSGKVKQVEIIRPLYIESPSQGLVVPPNGTVIYGLVYELITPLNFNQKLKARVSQESSADRYATTVIEQR
jgi:hypothetical protein